jgi:hypothetical protein
MLLPPPLPIEFGFAPLEWNPEINTHCYYYVIFFVPTVAQVWWWRRVNSELKLRHKSVLSMYMYMYMHCMHQTLCRNTVSENNAYFPLLSVWFFFWQCSRKDAVENNFGGSDVSWYSYYSRCVSGAGYWARKCVLGNWLWPTVARESDDLNMIKNLNSVAPSVLTESHYLMLSCLILGQ